MKLAAIVYDAGRGAEIDELIEAIARDLADNGLKLAGVVQSNEERLGQSRCDIVFRDLASGRLIAGSQNRGPHAQGCRLDSCALETAAGLAASALDGPIDIVIVNRFGKTESEGHGFRSVIERAIFLGLPVLVGLNAAYLESWRAFSGGEGTNLPTSKTEAISWCRTAMETRSTGSSAL